MQPFIIWLDKDCNSHSSFHEKLASYENVKTFNNLDDCLEYIRVHLMQNLFIITSGSFGKQLVPQIYEYPNIKQIFIFCGSILTHVEWAINYSDRLLMYDHPDDLLQRLWTDVAQYFREQAQECIYQADDFQKRAQQYQTPCG